MTTGHDRANSANSASSARRTRRPIVLAPVIGFGALGAGAGVTTLSMFLVNPLVSWFGDYEHWWQQLALVLAVCLVIGTFAASGFSALWMGLAGSRNPLLTGSAMAFAGAMVSYGGVRSVPEEPTALSAIVAVIVLSDVVVFTGVAALARHNRLLLVVIVLSCAILGTLLVTGVTG